ncbi:hypothetical protein ACIHEJ_06900 [Streptomyces sp. NPDC052301]|uniref:hypothetical protein n=1 Tax=Streptomyces sp. NPDC052301 TaxID=3365687 RepID=UPI0037D58235
MTTRRTFIGTATAVGAGAVLTGTTVPASFAADTTPVPDTSTAQAARKKLARDNIRAVDTAMRTNYDAMRGNLTKHLDPIIIVNNDMVGGTYYLVQNGAVVETVKPVDEVFEMAKSIAHTPLGIYSICAPSLDPKYIVPAQAPYTDPHDLEMVAYNGPKNTSWVTPLQDFSKTLDTARKTLADAKLPADLTTSCAYLIDRGQAFIADTLKRGEFSMDAFEAFSADVYPSIRTNMYYSSRYQIDGVSALMIRWRKQVGDPAWSNLYVLVFSLWTTFELNQNSIILKNFMDQSKVDSHLIDLMTAQTVGDPVAVGLDNLARIVMDNIAAEMVFSTDQSTADALKGRPDLLSTEILKLLGEAGTGANTASSVTKGQVNQLVCPFHNRSSKTPAVRA